MAAEFPDHLCQRLCLLPKWQFLHKRHVGGFLRQREYGVLVRAYDQVRLKISESLPVNFLTSFMDAHPVLDWKMSALGTMPIFHLMPCVLGKFPCRVIVDDVIDEQVGHLYPLILAQITRYLSWRPLVIGDIFLDSPNQFVGEFGVRRRPLSALHGHIVRLRPDILSRWRAVVL